MYCTAMVAGCYKATCINYSSGFEEKDKPAHTSDTRSLKWEKQPSGICYCCSMKSLEHLLRLPLCSFQVASARSSVDE